MLLYTAVSACNSLIDAYVVHGTRSDGYVDLLTLTIRVFTFFFVLFSSFLYGNCPYGKGTFAKAKKIGFLLFSSVSLPFFMVHG